MSSITTLTLFRFEGWSAKIWAFGQMQYAHPEMGSVEGLRFYKLMGSGRDLGFSPFPDWSVYALLCVWEHEAAAEQFLNQAPVFKRYQLRSSEHWTIFLKPIQAKGSWSGGNPFTPSAELDEAEPLVAVITRATIRPGKLIPFWRYVPISERPLQRAPKGLVFTKGIGEVPVLQMATFSVWESREALKQFAYNSPEHLEAIRKTRKIDWYKEELFVRFQPYRSLGTWGGSDLLASYWKV